MKKLLLLFLFYFGIVFSSHAIIISGTLSYSGNYPLANTTVKIAFDGNVHKYLSVLTTDANGHFQLNTPYLGSSYYSKYTISFSDTCQIKYSTTFPYINQNIVWNPNLIPCQQTYKIKGKVTKNGQAQASTWVGILQDLYSSSSYNIYDDTFTDQNGNYSYTLYHQPGMKNYFTVAVLDSCGIEHLHYKQKAALTSILNIDVPDCAFQNISGYIVDNANRSLDNMMVEVFDPMNAFGNNPITGTTNCFGFYSLNVPYSITDTNRTSDLTAEDIFCGNPKLVKLKLNGKDQKRNFILNPCNYFFDDEITGTIYKGNSVVGKHEAEVVLTKLDSNEAGYRKSMQLRTYTDLNGSYKFRGNFGGVFLLSASLTGGSVDYKDYIPSMLDSTVFWESAGQDTLGIQRSEHKSLSDLKLTPVKHLTGPGKIIGNAIDSTSMQRYPLKYADVILLDKNQKPLDYRHTGSLGTFEFDNLPMGTYYVLLESIAKKNSRLKIVLSQKNRISRIEMTEDKKRTYGGILTVTANNRIEDVAEMLVYPNPVKRKESLRIDGLDNISDKGIISLTNILGMRIFYDNFENIDHYDINIGDITTGIYILSVKGENGREFHSDVEVIE